MSRNFRLPRLPPCRDVGSEGIRHCPPPAFARHLSFLARLLLATERVASPETVMDSVAVPADIAVIVDLSCDDRATSDSQNIFNTYREWADSLLSSLICKRKRPSVAVLWVANVIGHLLSAYPDRVDWDYAETQSLTNNLKGHPPFVIGMGTSNSTQSSALVRNLDTANAIAVLVDHAPGSKSSNYVGGIGRKGGAEKPLALKVAPSRTA